MLQRDRGGFSVNGSGASSVATGKLARFFDCVLPVIEDHWLRHSIALTYLDSMHESSVANEGVGCGPVAFAALSGISEREFPTYFPEVSDKAWTNRKQMERAIEGFGWKFVKFSSGWPKLGFCFIHWHGPWTDRGYAHAVLQRTHWVAVIGDYVFDVNWHGWLPKENWEDVVVSELLRGHRSARGWLPLTAYELDTTSVNCAC